ncbi:hypothetical protein MPSEU_000474500 [Mayamaea pseudoterrestris]|nr:hypothetical protein MPSEU_000474500 [Mayamaea pseudoterrestris]
MSERAVDEVFTKKHPAMDDCQEEQEDSQQRKRAHLDVEATASVGDVTVNYCWLDAGLIDVESGRNYHEAIRLTVGSGLVVDSFNVHRGDVVRLNAEQGAAEDGSDVWMCKVIKLWDDGDTVAFRGLWLFSRDEINQYTGPWGGILSKSGLVKKMRSKECVLSDRGDDNDIGSILSVVKPVHQIPGYGIDVPRGSVLCRYRIETMDSPWMLFEYRGESVDRADDHNTDEPTLTNDTLDDDHSSASSSGERSTFSDQVRIEGEGSNLRGDIQIGPKFQVDVPPFSPGAPYNPTSGRKPQLVWRADSISDDALHSFLKQLSMVLNDYLEKHGLTTLDGPPYTPLPIDKAEAFMAELNVDRLYPSHMSSASSLTLKQSGLLKECDIDAALQFLHEHGYNIEKALDAIKTDLSKVTNGWTRTEKNIFNDGYRQEQGVIRNIAKLFQPMKTHKDVIDYWYRFKISDQFRLYQERKREQAIRMIECIETRRFHEFTLSAPRVEQSSGHQAKDAHWSETSTAEIASASDERRQVAKTLLLDITERMGSSIMAEIAAVLRELHESYDVKLKKHLFTLLVGQPELQQRILEFVPK